VSPFSFSGRATENRKMKINLSCGHFSVFNFRPALKSVFSFLLFNTKLFSAPLVIKSNIYNRRIAMPFIFEKLDVYQKAVGLAEKVSGLTDSFPKGNYYLIDQFNRAALSISTNLAEGNGRWHLNDKKQFFWIARGSAQECVPILEICMRKKLVPENLYRQIRAELDVIVKMISGLVKMRPEATRQQGQKNLDRGE
jgi:four helix bundle protein